MIEPGLYTHLVAQVPSVAGRVRPGVLEQNETYPAITYEAISDPRGYDHAGADGMIEARYQISSWGGRGRGAYKVAQDVAQEVETALAGFTGAMGGVTVASIRHEGGSSPYDQEVEVHRRMDDYVIQYTR